MIFLFSIVATEMSLFSSREPLERASGKSIVVKRQFHSLTVRLGPISEIAIDRQLILVVPVTHFFVYNEKSHRINSLVDRSRTHPQSITDRL